MNKKNFIFNQKKEIKFIHVPKNRIKKKIENRTFEDFQRRKQLIQDEKQYFRKKKVNYYQEIKEKNQREILKELESKKDIRDILNEEPGEFVIERDSNVYFKPIDYNIEIPFITLGNKKY